MKRDTIAGLLLFGGMTALIASSSISVHSDPRISPEEYEEITSSSYSVGVPGSLIGTISAKVVRYATRHEEKFINHLLVGTYLWDGCLEEFPYPLSPHHNRELFYECLSEFDE